MGPVFAIVLFNAVVFIIITAVLIKHTRRSMARKNESLDKDKTILRLMLSIAGVMSLFGLSWLFGALTITTQEVRIVFEVLFAIFTSLQGFFIFLFFCVFSQVARELWKETLSCGQYKSKILDPSLKFSGGRKYRPNISHNSANTTSRSTQETDLTLQRPESSSIDTSQHNGDDNQQTESTGPTNASQELAKPTHNVEIADINDDSDIVVNRGALDDTNGEVQTSTPDSNIMMTTISPSKPVPKKRTKINKGRTAMAVRAEIEAEEDGMETTEMRIEFTIL